MRHRRTTLGTYAAALVILAIVVALGVVTPADASTSWLTPSDDDWLRGWDAQ